MKNKNIYLLKKDSYQEVIKSLKDDFGLPKISSSLVIYSKYKDRVLETKFINSECFFRTHNKSSDIDSKFIDLFGTVSSIKIENRNIKLFLKILDEINLSKVFISDNVIKLDFILKGKIKLSLYLNTSIGDLCISKDKELKNIIDKKHISSELLSIDIDSIFEKKVKPDIIFNKFGALNEKIINYGNDFGIELTSSGLINLESKLSVKSNNYSFFEEIYKKITEYELNSIDSESVNKNKLKKYFKPLSIIIPSYNSNDTILKTLYSIQSQNLFKEHKKLIDVIVVDDGSNESVFSIVEPHIKNFDFNLNILRMESNKGLSNARNIGISSSKYEMLLFIDSDIVLPSNYLLEHSISLQMIPNGLFVSMKKNIENDSISLDKISKGVAIPRKYDDKRLLRVFKKKQLWVNDVELDGVFETLSDTNLFKKFGHGRIINGYDLPSMVAGHNMSINKSLLNFSGSFSDEFVGWGLEDTYFGARIISKGNFIIPLLNTGVYHINHKPRSGNSLLQEKEYQRNIKKYKELIKRNE